VSRFGLFREKFSTLGGSTAAHSDSITGEHNTTSEHSTTHENGDARRPPGRPRKRGVLLTASSGGLVLVAGVAIAAFAAPGSHAATTMTAADRTAVGVKARADVPTAPLQIVSVTPTPNSHAANGGQPVTIVFSEPLATNSPMPTLSPHIAGSWQVAGDSAVFTPTAGYMASTKVTLNIPGGANGVQADGTADATTPGAGLLATSVKDTFTTGSFSTLRLQELLSKLGYLPLNWKATSSDPAASNASGQVAAAYDPPSGTFTWQSGYPSILRTFWLKGKSNLITKGAIRAFEWNQGLTMDGVAGPNVWKHLLSAVAAGKDNAHGYTYALASKASPESLTIWHNGKQVLKTLANTGIAAAPTTDGTFPVYLRYYYQIMKGLNPDGTKYADPVYYVSYFNEGEAVHYFDRGSYGFPQSLGCVELPWSSAAKAWPYLTYGSLVTVQG
jgi:peptidoglycan hydrolase-like protein with peptidoglycan-binding domain